MGTELPTAIVHHEPLVDELGRDVQRRAAHALLAITTWDSTLAAQALVRALGTSDVPGDRDIARRLVLRIAETAVR